MRLIDAVTLKAEFTGNFNGGYYTVPEIHAHIDVAPTIGGWISVKDRLPEKEGYYLTYRVSPICGEVISRSYWRSKTAFIFTPESEEIAYCCFLDKSKMVITHWMPLPEPPEEEI